VWCGGVGVVGVGGVQCAWGVGRWCVWGVGWWGVCVGREESVPGLPSLGCIAKSAAALACGSLYNFMLAQAKVLPLDTLVMREAG